MKRFLHRLSLLFVVLLLLTTAVFADFGPNPQLVVRVEQPPQEEYYLDLLDTGDWAKNLYDLDERELDPALLAALRAAVPSGWHACIAQGSTRAPIWGELTGEPDGSGAMLHSFRYYGVPETYRILMVTASGETFLSDVLTRRTLQSSVTVDWTAKTAKPPLQSVGYLLQFAATFVPTILIELVVLLLFGFKLKENWKPFLLVNLVTQGLLHGCFSFFALQSGVSWFYFLLFFPAEAVVTLIESCVYARTLRGRSKRRAVLYAICANVCSAALGYVLAEPVWHLAASLL